MDWKSPMATIQTAQAAGNDKAPSISGLYLFNSLVECLLQPCEPRLRSNSFPNLPFAP